MGRTKKQVIGIGQIRAMTYDKAVQLNERELNDYVKATKSVIRKQIFGSGKQRGLLDKYKSTLMKNPDAPLPPVISHTLQRAVENEEGEGIKSLIPYKTKKEIKAITDKELRKIAMEEREYIIAQNERIKSNNIQYIENWYFDESSRWQKILNTTYEGRNEALSAFSDLRRYATRKTIFESGFEQYNADLRRKMEAGIKEFTKDDYSLSKEEFDKIIRIFGRLGFNSTTPRERFYEAERNLIIMYRQGEFGNLTEEEIANRFNEFEKEMKFAEFNSGSQKPAHTLKIRK